MVGQSYDDLITENSAAAIAQRPYQYVQSVMGISPQAPRARAVPDGARAARNVIG
jgi:hypothetical protein